ncbi:UxaA family hydrolase [Petrotoga sp. 9PWA.NaAc.5.4]|uniref:UxaA family hydrolase n=1 Tax=Petrotoga sp. 9PWA.NaAc.5.4 TaxID=1434328 RepID=UPI000CBAE987|nr:UxaA family hydrolase [Petrotoga sp. 9PWA.NaAc.5.4]PNR96762.1 flagellar protein FlgA [Petrotoga sp. 9PWA.NaAc.5.4]
MKEYRFLVHEEGDSVGVVTSDLKAGETIIGKNLEKDIEYEIKVLEEIPLGNKVALKDIKEGEEIIEYGEKIGVATKPIKKGERVHVHNIKSIRWGGKVNE